MNSTLHAEEEQWWPSDAGISGGTAALMHLCLITNDKGVQRWTGMALHRLCLNASPSLVDRIILNRGVQSMLQLVYSRVVEISSYAFSTLALLSSTESKSSRRALFQAGVMFPVTKLVRNGPLDTKLAAAHILANLVKDDSILDDMLSTGCDDCLEVAFHLLSLPPSGDWVGSAARRDGRLIAASASSQSLSPSQDEALIEIIQRSLEVLQAVCLHQRHQPRFLMLTGLQVCLCLCLCLCVVCVLCVCVCMCVTLFSIFHSMGRVAARGPDAAAPYVDMTKVGGLSWSILCVFCERKTPGKNGVLDLQHRRSAQKLACDNLNLVLGRFWADLQRRKVGFSL